MNLIDSSVWLEYFAEGPQVGQFAAVIEGVDELLVPTIVLVEVTRRCCSNATKMRRFRLRRCSIEGRSSLLTRVSP